MFRLFFGGSFNPIHNGHLASSRAAAEALGRQQVVLVPTGQPPHKVATASMAAAQHRLAMVRLAVAGDPFFSVDDIELQRDGPSYTIDTARVLTSRGDGPVHWLIGADMLLYLPKWRSPEDLLREVHFVVMSRGGWEIDWHTLPQSYWMLQKNVVLTPMLEISSSAIRQRVAEGKSIRYLAPPAVCDYIAAHNLYRNADGSAE